MPISCGQIRCEGIRLFLLWLQALRDNCAEEQFLIFACLVPGFPAVPSSRGPCTLDTIIYNPFSTPPDGNSIMKTSDMATKVILNVLNGSEMVGLISLCLCEQTEWCLRRLPHWFLRWQETRLQTTRPATSWKHCSSIWSFR